VLVWCVVAWIRRSPEPIEIERRQVARPEAEVVTA
jgi:hypothetical protein